MIGQFPTPYPDELFYSLLARYKQRVKYPSNKKLLKEVFGSETSTVIHDLPCNLEFFSKSLPVNEIYTVDYILKNLTLLPYYSAFSSNEIITKTKRQMAKTKGSGIHARLGLMATKVSMPQYLRYCPLCVLEEFEKFEETYWHRSHQLPGVFVCIKHQIRLLNSQIKTTASKSSNIFIDANEILLDTKNIFNCESPNTVMHKIAAQSVFLLEQNRNPRDKVELKNRYNYLLIKKGLANYAGSLRVSQIIREFSSFYSKIELSLFGCELNQNYDLEESWIVRLLRKPHTFRHPVYHLLVINFLGIGIQDFFSIPTDLNWFGKSPWYCLNPTASHFKKRVITDFKPGNRIRRGKSVGIFSCECGFEYARSGPDTRQQDKFRIDKIIKFGSIWEAELVRLWNESNKTITEVSRCLKVDPMTVRRYATKFNLSFDRIGKHYQGLTEKDKLKSKPKTPKRKLKSVKSKQSRQFKSAGYIDWESRDDKLSVLVEETAARIRASTKRPRAVTKTAIGKEADCLALLLKKLHKLPKTAQKLDSVVDTDLTFAIRRINWVANDSREKGIKLKKWQLIDAACVYRFRHIPIIKQTIEFALRLEEDDKNLKISA